MDSDSEQTSEQVDRHCGMRGTNQSGMRDRNERLILSLVRRHGALAKTDIARMTGLSAQTVSVIMRELEADHLLLRGKPQQGRVGQPSVPLSLNPDGAFFIGAKVGRRSLDVVLVDFTGAIRWQSRTTYAYPLPSPAVRLILNAAEGCAVAFGPLGQRIKGLGIALPSAVWAWAEAIGAPAAELATWREANLRADLAAALPYPVYLQNDATAACGAELVFGQTGHPQDFVYFYVGVFVGGGVVLNGALFAGRSGNAGALGSMPVPGPDGRLVQLLERASLAVLAHRLTALGCDPELMQGDADAWLGLGAPVEKWIEDAGAAIAHAIVASAAVIDFEAAVVDGAFPPVIRDRLVASVAAALDEYDLSGINPPRIEPGTLGVNARALGGASLPLFARYLIDRSSP